MVSKKKTAEYRKRAKELIAKMTLEEKVYQLRHTAPAIERLGIPAYNYWNEALHGVARAGIATIFPQAIGLAATFDSELVGEVADTIATEGRGKYNAQYKYDDHGIYKGLTFWAPNINIFRDPRWGRGHETYGEDPYLTSRLGVSFVKGIQGDDENYLKAAACAKHFAVHSGPEAVRHHFNAECNKQDLRETYLPAFKALVQEAGVEAVMGAYNRTNGEPCCGSETLLRDILRNEWGFDGHVTSDCWAIKDMNEGHAVTKTPAESVARAINAGCDLNCGNLYEYLLQAVEQGLTTEEKIDTALENVLTTRFKLGLFDESSPYSDIDYSKVDSKEARELNLKTAKECVVLLKNDNILPLDGNSIKTIGVIGPNADNRRALVGNYEGTASEYITVLDGIRREADKFGIRVFAGEGCALYKNRLQNLATENDRLAEVKAVCECSDVVVACMGLDASLEGEEGDTGNEYGSGDKPNLCFPGLQQQIIDAIAESGKPAILVVLAGSALALDKAAAEIPAVIQGWYPGALGGRAIAEIIFGESSPEGRLPVTFYSENNILPDFENYSMKGRTYRYMSEKPLYPFGYGLSYTSFGQKISGIGLWKNNGENPAVVYNPEFDTDIPAVKLTENDILAVNIAVNNTGKYDGGVTVQCYIGYSFDDAPVRQLKNLKKLHISAGGYENVQMKLGYEDFGLYNENGEFEVRPGKYTVSFGDSQPDVRSFELTGIKCEGFEVIIEK